MYSFQQLTGKTATSSDFLTERTTGGSGADMEEGGAGRDIECCRGKSQDEVMLKGEADVLRGWTSEDDG
ncbi:hypothetical protein ATANTOWER_030086 [Ataeniobius toweri]|uniref:Uncharacterized protein n=1 Tax=Ataeniobius toweri TaxID=208326 RepID=A0ABU7BL56_9TELE|nr:hypothetical protein [Ataeniobius toweri]